MNEIMQIGHDEVTLHRIVNGPTFEALNQNEDKATLGLEVGFVICDEFHFLLFLMG